VKRSSTPSRSRKVIGELLVKDVMLPNFLQVSADGKHWLTMPVSQMHPKILRKIGRQWTAALVAKSKFKVKK
jgi:hypothetical protein